MTAVFILIGVSQIIVNSAISSKSSVSVIDDIKLVPTSGGNDTADGVIVSIN